MKQLLCIFAILYACAGSAKDPVQIKAAVAESCRIKFGMTGIGCLLGCNTIIHHGDEGNNLHDRTRACHAEERSISHNV